MKTEMKTAVKTFNKIYDRVGVQLATAYEMDCGYDGGEFCGKWHEDEQERVYNSILSLVAKKFDVNETDLEIAVQQYRFTFEEKLYNAFAA